VVLGEGGLLVLDVVEVELPVLLMLLVVLVVLERRVARGLGLLILRLGLLRASPSGLGGDVVVVSLAPPLNWYASAVSKVRAIALPGADVARLVEDVEPRPSRAGGKYLGRWSAESRFSVWIEGRDRFLLRGPSSSSA